MIIYELMNFDEQLTQRTLQLPIIKHDCRCLHYLVALFNDLLVILLFLGVHGGCEFGLCGLKVRIKINSVAFNLVSEIIVFFQDTFWISVGLVDCFHIRLLLLHRALQNNLEKFHHLLHFSKLIFYIDGLACCRFVRDGSFGFGSEFGMTF